jgi:hypothetical protein
MRFTMATATGVALAAALLAGCSTSSPGSSAIPGTGVGQPTAGHIRPDKMYQPKGGINPKDLLKLQAEGRIPAPGGRMAAEKALHKMPFHPKVHAHGGSGTGIWSNMTYYDYILGFSANGKKVTAAIDTSDQSEYCEEPQGLKIDSSQNIWVGCYYGGYYGSPTAQEYSKNGNLSGTYSFSCPNGWGGCDGYFYGYEGYDVAVNSSDVFMNGYYYGYDCATSSCEYEDAYGIEYWPNGQPDATPSIIPMPNDFSTTYVYDLYGMDVDSSGNLWVAFYGYTSSNGEYGYALAEITNPTSDPSFNVIEPAGTYEYDDAVYTSNSGGKVNVLDGDTREIYQYNLPLTYGGSPSKTLGPTAPFGEPAGLGFNASDTKVVAGDEDDWLNIGTVSSNKWTQTKPVLLIDSLFGSGYTPSDK